MKRSPRWSGLEEEDSMPFAEGIRAHKAQFEQYLKERFGAPSRLIDMEPLGKGTHGTAFRVRFSVSGKEEALIMKTLFPEGFGHDHVSDRARVLLLAHSNYNEFPLHVESKDALCLTPRGFLSLDGVEEFYILMEEAGGSSYFKDLDAILQRGALRKSDMDRALFLASFLADVHGAHYGEGNAPTLYRRRIRELVGHGECIMGMVDAFPENDVITQGELVEYVSACIPWWGRLRNRSGRLCAVHGDFHPGNIRFGEEGLRVLDRARGTWGEAADDVSCLAINYLYYALKHTGAFAGPFGELFKLFIHAYVENSADEEIFDVSQPFFAFRALVIANPEFYPDESRETRRKLLNFGRSVLEHGKWHMDEISDYMEGP